MPLPLIFSCNMNSAADFAINGEGLQDLSTESKYAIFYKKLIFQVVVESDKFPPQPPLLQTEQPQLPQPLLTRLVLQTPHQPRCPSLDMIQPLNVLLVVRGPELNTALEVVSKLFMFQRCSLIECSKFSMFILRLKYCAINKSWQSKYCAASGKKLKSLSSQNPNYSVENSSLSGRSRF